MIIASVVGVVSSNVFYFNFLTALSPDTMQICVRHCPNDTLLTHTDIWDLHTNQNITLCRYDVMERSLADVEADPDVNASSVCPDLPIPPL